MPVKHAVLGLLLEHRGYGYEVAQRLSDRLGPRLAVPEGTVHSALRNLKRDGYVQVEKRTFRGDQVAVWYGATDSGREAYEAWLDAPLAREPVRDDLYLKFAMVDPRRLAHFKQEFQRLELECVGEIAVQTRAVPLADEVEDPVSWDVARRLLLDSRALDHLNGDLAFIRRTLGVLRWAESQDGSVPRDRLLEAVS